MRNAWSHRESELAAERKRRNQHSGCCGGGDGGGRERGSKGFGRRERNVEREWEVCEMRDSRARDWEGRRERSLWERKDCAVEVTPEIMAARFCGFGWFRW